MLSPVDKGEEGGLDVRLLGAAQDAGQRVVGEEPAGAHEQQPVAAARLVHDVAGHEQRDAVVREPAEDRPQVAAQDGVEAHGRLVEHEQLGRPDQGRGERDARALAAGELVDPHLGVVAEHDLGDHPLHLGVEVAAADADDGREVPQVLGDRQVVVDAGLLGDVADPAPQRRAAGRQAEDLDVAALDDLDTDDRPHERGLATAARAEQADDLTAVHGHVQARDDDAPATHHPQVPDGDGGCRRPVIHHAMNLRLPRPAAQAIQHL